MYLLREKKLQRFPPTVRPCSQTLDTRTVPCSLMKQQSLGDHFGLGARKSERANRGMAFYSVQADWRARVRRDMSEARGAGGGRTGGNGIVLAGNEVELEGETGSDTREWGQTGGEWGRTGGERGQTGWGTGLDWMGNRVGLGGTGSDWGRTGSD